MNLKQSRGLWLHDPAKAMGHLHEIKSIGFDYILVKIAEGRSGYSPNTTRALLKDAASMGLPVVPWVYLRPGEAQAQAAAIADYLPKGCTDLVLDAEVEFEQCADSDGEAQAAVHAIAAQTGHRVALHLSTFWSPQFHPRFPFKAFLTHCAAVGGSFMPQAYFEGGRTREEILKDTLAQAPAVLGRPDQPVIVTINHTGFVPLLKAAGVHGFSTWLWDDDGDARVRVSKQDWQHALAA